MPLAGWATLEGTARYRERFREVAAKGYFRQQQDLWLSSIGAGTYLGDADNPTDARYAEAVTLAIESGANVIDTAANYRFQRSERSIGKALLGVNEQGFARDEIVICTKGGYLPFDGAPPRDVRQYIEETFVKPGIAGFTDIAGGAHCMTPRYLESQLRQSLVNMNLSCVDVYYVHNPESQLPVVSPEEFWQRLRAAFEFLEQSVAAEQLGLTAIASGSLLQGQVARGLPEAIRGPLGSLATDAQTGIQFVRSAPGITTALVGMSQGAHVEENLQLVAVARAQPDDLLSVFDQE